MPNFLDSCEEYFDANNLYDVLKVSKTATDNEVKRAYRKRSLEVHPDRVGSEEKELATEKFKVLGKVYTILSDAEKRAAYDETGVVDEEDEVFEDKDWASVWRCAFPKMNLKDIEDFENKYRESDEELQDLKQSYVDGEGDMDYILNNVLCARYEDEQRFRKIIQGLIDDEEVPEFDAFVQESKVKKSKRAKRAKNEAKEAEALAKELNINSGGDLAAMIQKRHSERAEQADSFLDSLAAKYASQEKKKKAGGKPKKSAKK